MRPVLIWLQGDRESNAENIEQLRWLRDALPDVALVLVRRRVAWWQWDLREVRQLVERVVLADPTDWRRTSAALCGLAVRVPVVGVGTVNEDCLECAAALAEQLGLPTPGLAAVTRCRDKCALIETLQHAAGISVPRTERVSSWAEVKEAAARVGFPLVVKPRFFAASIGVVRADRPEDLRWAFDVARNARWGHAPVGAVLVQQFVAGRCLTANGTLDEGQFSWNSSSTKQTAGAPFFLTHQDEMSAEADNGRLAGWVAEVCQQVGLRHGVVHAEVVERPDGELVLLELAPRPGGGYVAQMAEAHSGLNLVVAAAQLALGRRVSNLSDSVRSRPAVLGRYLFASSRGRIVALQKPPCPPRGMVTWYRDLGDRVSLPPQDYFRAVGSLVLVDQPGGESLSTRADRYCRELFVEQASNSSPRVGMAIARRLVAPRFRRHLWSRFREGLFRSGVNAPRGRSLVSWFES